MNQNIKKFIPLSLGIAAALFSFLSFIFVIVLDGEGWDYANSILTFIAIGGLLAIVILNFLNIPLNKLIYLIPLGVIMLTKLFIGLEALIGMGDTYKTYRYSYFNNFVSAVINILIIGLLAYAIYKSKFIITSACSAYLAINLFISGLSGFNRMFFSLFTDDKFKYGFSSFSKNSAMFLFYVVYIYFVYSDYKSKNN